MKHLYLIRHAKSSWKQPDLPDFDRPLNERGQHDAPRMGQRLRKMKICPDLILTSPARRTAATAKIIADEISFPGAEIVEDIQLYLANIREFLEVVHRLKESVRSAALIGHNPGITDFANFLTGANIENIPTCGIFGIELDVHHWNSVEKGLGRQLFFDFPKNHR